MDIRNDPVTTDDGVRRSRRQQWSRYLWLGGVVIIAVAVGVTVMLTRPDEHVRVAADRLGNRPLHEPSVDSTSTTTTAPRTEATTSTSTVQVQTPTTTTGPTTSSTTTTGPPTTTTTTTGATVSDQTPTYAQGPASPTIKTLGNYASADHQGDPHYLPLFIGAQDDDGWISRFVVDWGDDTSPTTYVYNPFPCKAMPPTGWPAGNYVSLPSDTTNPLIGIDGQPVPSTEHFYVASGNYTVAVTVHSTACDGSQPQEGTSTMTWSVT